MPPNIDLYFSAAKKIASKKHILYMARRCSGALPILKKKLKKVRKTEVFFSLHFLAVIYYIK